MRRSAVLKSKVIDVENRLRLIEATPLPYTLGALLDEAAVAAGDHLIWDFFESGEQVTYAQLRRDVHAAAFALSELGIKQGTHVAVMLPNIPTFPTTWLALALIGAVMVPVNTSYTSREIEFILQDSNAHFLVVHQAFLEKAWPLLRRKTPLLNFQNVVLVDPVDVNTEFATWSKLLKDGYSNGDFTDHGSTDGIMNIQYTSGTTGLPKGCVLTQRYWLTLGKVQAFRDGRKYERILCSTPFYYMDPQWLLTMALYQRGTLFVAARQSSSRFMEWIRRYRIQFCLLPAIVHKNPQNTKDRENELIRANIYGVPPDLHAGMEERFDAVIRESYGMTEIGSALFMPMEATEMVGSGSCGKPSPFRRCRLVDPASGLVTDQEGELQVCGPGIFQGYYNNSDANDKSFQDSWFRTGDMFRRDSSGYYYIVGRLKDMIRRSSENISAREVEMIINAFDPVLESAVIPVPDETRGEEVKAFVVVRRDLEQVEEVINGLISHCEANLARFKIPRYFEFVKELPKTPTLKIAKHILLNSHANQRSGAYDRVLQKWVV